MSKYDIFDFRIGERNHGRTRVVNIHIKLPSHPDDPDPTYLLGFLTKDNIDDINKLYGDL